MMIDETHLSSLNCICDLLSFYQILASIESIMRALPKITRSTSEPILHCAKPGSEVELPYPCATPRTPIHNPLVFNFSSSPAVAY